MKKRRKRIRAGLLFRRSNELFRQHVPGCSPLNTLFHIIIITHSIFDAILVFFGSIPFSSALFRFLRLYSVFFGSIPFSSAKMAVFISFLLYGKIRLHTLLCHKICLSVLPHRLPVIVNVVSASVFNQPVFLPLDNSPPPPAM